MGTYVPYNVPSLYTLICTKTAPIKRAALDNRL